MQRPAALLKSPWAGYPRVILVCLVLAVAVSIPGLWMGLFVDDYFHVALLEKLVPYGNLFNLFDFAPGNPDILRPRIVQGPFPWFTLPEMKASFFRPLSCLLTAMDHAVFGRHFVVWHLHSVLWYLLFVLAWGLILWRLIPGPVGAVALVILALDPVHWFPVTWLANRNALVGAVPALWGLYAHIRWREDHWKPGLPLSVLGYVTGLLGGEAALGVFAYLAAYEVAAGHGALSRRIRSLGPAAVVGICYLLVYKAYGYGAYGSGLYIDPIQEPLEYLAHVPERILTLIAGGLAGIPADLSVFALWLRPVQALAGIVTLALFAACLHRAWPAFEPAQRRVLTWTMLGALLSLLPVAATFPTTRLLLTPSLGASVLLASVLVYWWNRRVEGRGTRLLGAFAWFLVIVHLILAPIAWVAQSTVLTILGKQFVHACVAADMGAPTAAGYDYVVLVSPDPFTAIYTPLVRAVVERRAPAHVHSWLVVSQAPYAHRITRTDADRIEVEVIGGSMLETEFERLFRAPRFPVEIGQRIDLGHATICVLELGKAGPSKIAVEFQCLLEDPSLWFMAWKDGRLQRFTFPPIGGSIVLPRERGLM